MTIAIFGITAATVSIVLSSARLRSMRARAEVREATRSRKLNREPHSTNGIGMRL